MTAAMDRLPFVFRHLFFERHRRDLLSNIKRAKKRGGNYNHRFDEMQQQIDALSDKLDLLITLVTANDMMSPGDAIVGGELIPLGKRFRKNHESSELFEVSELTASTKSGSSYSSSSESSGKSDLSMFSETENVTEEEDALKELRGSTQGLDDIHQNAAILQQGVDDDFKAFIDGVLGEGKEAADDVSGLGRQDIVQNRSTEMVAEEEVWDNNSIKTTMLPSWWLILS
jgi:hypothetical protein